MAMGSASSDGARRQSESRNETQRVNGNRRSTNDDFFPCFVILRCYGCMLLVVLMAAGFALLLAPSNDPCFRTELISQDVSASITISNNSTSSIRNYVSADLKLTLSFKNNDQELKRMEPLLAAIKYGDEVLYSTEMDPFFAVSQEHKTFPLDISIRASNLKDATVYSMVKDLAVNQAVEFRLIIQGRCWISVSHPRNSDYGQDTTIPVRVSSSSFHLQLTPQTEP